MVYLSHLIGAIGFAFLIGSKVLYFALLACAALLLTYLDTTYIFAATGWKGLLYTLLCFVCLVASWPNMRKIGFEPVKKRRLVALGALLILISIGLQLWIL
jgi:hypothetical protein